MTDSKMRDKALLEGFKKSSLQYQRHTHLFTGSIETDEDFRQILSPFRTNKLLLTL